MHREPGAAIVKCAHCGTEFAVDAKRCPECGGTLTVKQPSQVGGWAMIIIGLFLTPACVGIILIIVGVSMLKNASTPYWYCIDCGYARGRQRSSGSVSTAGEEKDINVSAEPYFIFESGFRDNPAFKASPEHVRASFEEAFVEYNKGNYALAGGALEKILYDDPTNKSALWGKIGLLFVKPIEVVDIEDPLRMLRGISEIIETDEEKARFEKGVINTLSLFYDYYYQRGLIDEALLRRLMAYIDFLTEIDYRDVTYRKYALDLINRAGFKDSDIWEKYHTYLLENDDEFKRQYDDGILIAARNKELVRAVLVAAAAICVQTVIGLIMGFIFLSAVASADPDVGNAPPPPAEVEEGPPTAKVLASAIEVRESPSDWARTIDAVFEGEEVKVLGRDEASKWYKVETPGGEVGWMEAENWEGPTLEF